MRYYDLSLYQSGGTGTPYRSWTSHPNGQFDPAAPDVEFDVPVTCGHAPAGGQTITIYGVPITDLMQPQTFVGLNLVLKGGMGKGLPLANPAQQNILLSGQVWQAFGNWEGTEMTLDLVVNAGGFDSDNPGNFVLNWQAGQPLSTAIQQCLSVVYPTLPLSINVSPQLVQNWTEPHFCGTFEELAQHIFEITNGQFLGESYPGVRMAIQNGTLNVFDNTVQPSPVQLNFTDLIGQPTWIDRATMQLKLVMRGDLQIQTPIKMPLDYLPGPGSVTLTQNSVPTMWNNKTTFDGKFLITAMRHIGLFRDPSGTSWSTIVNCTPDLSAQTSTSNG